MANMSRLLMETRSLSATRDDPRKSWEFFSLPPSQQKRQTARSQKKRQSSIQKLLSIILDNALKLP